MIFYVLSLTQCLLSRTLTIWHIYYLHIPLIYFLSLIILFFLYSLLVTLVLRRMDIEHHCNAVRNIIQYIILFTRVMPSTVHFFRCTSMDASYATTWECMLKIKSCGGWGRFSSLNLNHKNLNVTLLDFGV